MYQCINWCFNSSSQKPKIFFKSLSSFSGSLRVIVDSLSPTQGAR
ncbi:hypothetical protein HMPREF9371_0689, partial [Neisseria shayeganii 871]